MGGKSGSGQTIGYWYKLLLLFGWGRGPFDALLEIRGGDKTAWQGYQAESGTITINALNLWGGEKSEGGIQGDFDVMMGEADQAVNPYLAANMPGPHSARRGKATGLFKGGKYGAFNPYPKAMAFLVTKIIRGWLGVVDAEDDVCWYEAKAPIVFSGEGGAESGETVVPWGDTWNYLEVPRADHTSYASATEGSGWGLGQAPFGGKSGGVRPASPPPGLANTLWHTHTRLWLFKRVVTVGDVALTVYVSPNMDDTVNVYWNGVAVATQPDGDALGGLTVTIPAEDVTGFDALVIQAVDRDGAGHDEATEYCWFDAVVYYATSAPARWVGMNPAHMLYKTLVSPDYLGEPADMVDEASFMAAADKLFAEGFALCTTYDPTHEDVSAFQARILNLISGSLSQSRVDGRYYLTLVRDDYVLEDLPILGDDDIIDYQEEPGNPLESVNQVSVEWFDPIRKEKRTTTPIQSLGAIQATGGIIAETGQYPEIPYEGLALRKAGSDLSQKSSPLKRFKLVTNRVPYAWRASTFFRLQAPRRGIADMVCLLGEIDAGVLRSGTMRLTAMQHVSSMPTAVYVTPEPGIDTTPSDVPSIVTTQDLFEAPYVELVRTMTTADRDALEDDAGFVLAVGAAPAHGLGYDLETAADAEDFADRGSGDWCPTATVVEAGTIDPDQVDFTLDNADRLDEVVAGQACLWGLEVCRVDAIDAEALTVTLGRGCADTVPAEHAAGERVWFYQDNTATDAREYSDGETVHAKLLTRTASQRLRPEMATPMTTVMDSRFARPYPPGLFAVNGDPLPAALWGELIVSWAHRDRILQADMLVDNTDGPIGPEPGTTYTARYYADAVLEHTETDIDGDSTTFTPAADAAVYRVEVEAVRDGLVSWQLQAREFVYTVAEPARLRTELGDTFITETGDRLSLE